MGHYTDNVHSVEKEEIQGRLVPRKGRYKVFPNNVLIRKEIGYKPASSFFHNIPLRIGTWALLEFRNSGNFNSSLSF